MNAINVGLCVGGEGHIHSFLTWPLNRCEQSASRLGRFTPLKGRPVDTEQNVIRPPNLYTAHAAVNVGETGTVASYKALQ